MSRVVYGTRMCPHQAGRNVRHKLSPPRACDVITFVKLDDRGAGYAAAVALYSLHQTASASVAFQQGNDRARFRQAGGRT
jgi:hypothetical protein